MRDLISEIMQTLRSNKLRTALTGIAVSWGVFMLIVLLSMARGVTNAFEYQASTGNPAELLIWSGLTSKPYKGNPEGRYIRFRKEDMTHLGEDHPDIVENVTSDIYSSGEITTPKAKLSISYIGVAPSAFVQKKIGEMKEGRFINERDMNDRAKSMVLPMRYAAQLFPPDGEGALGSIVSCNGVSFRVVGIYESRWRRDIYIPFTTARMMAENKDGLDNLTVTLKNVSTEEDGEIAEAAVRKSLSTARNFDPDDSRAMYIWNSFTNYLQAKGAMGILTTSMWVLGILTLLTGIVGISNIMFVSVRERTHEIGIRRAIGAKPRSILTQVIAEAVAITVLFGYIGIVLGNIVTQIISHIIGEVEFLRNPTVSLSLAFQVTAVLVVAGAVAGLFPAIKALKVKPVEALRDE